MTAAIALALVMQVTGPQEGNPTTTQAAPQEGPAETSVSVAFSKLDRVVRCREFEIKISSDERLLLVGKFRSQFRASREMRDLSFRDARFAVEVRCGRERWKFTGLEFRFVPSAWEFGTHARPFKLDWEQELDRTVGASRIEYLHISPADGSMDAYLFRRCVGDFKRPCPPPQR
jgi:hypothetical protein